jgi:hypothetical protein
MVQISTQPVNITNNRQISVVPSGQAIGYGTIACVIYNTTPFILQVTHSGGVNYLQPNSADVMPFITGVYPTMSPVFTNLPLVLTNSAQPIYAGTVTATFYDVNDGEPDGYPQAIVPFSGGALLTASNIPASTGAFTLVVPQGTTQLTFNIISGSATLLVIGYTSSSTYYNAAVTTGRTVTFAVPAANLDTIFLCNAGGAVVSMYAIGI